MYLQFSSFIVVLTDRNKDDTIGLHFQFRLSQSNQTQNFLLTRLNFPKEMIKLFKSAKYAFLLSFIYKNNSSCFLSSSHNNLLHLTIVQ